MIAPSQQPGYFDALYAADRDPWRFETSAYERHKYDTTLAALPRAPYRSAVEVGCSIGVLTQRLAERCDRLLGTDVSEVALEAAAARCAHLAHVGFERSRLPANAPRGRFDLVVLSEVLYYFDSAELALLPARIEERFADDATVLLVHWLGPTPDYPLTGDQAVELFEAALNRPTALFRHRTPDYRLDLLAPVRSAR